MGRPEKGLRRLAQDAQAANTRGDRQQRRDHAHGELLHHAAEHPGRAANHLPGLQSWVAVSISRAVCAARHAVPEGLSMSRKRETKNMKEKKKKKKKKKNKVNHHQPTTPCPTSPHPRLFCLSRRGPDGRRQPQRP